MAFDPTARTTVNNDVTTMYFKQDAYVTALANFNAVQAQLTTAQAALNTAVADLTAAAQKVQADAGTYIPA